MLENQIVPEDVQRLVAEHYSVRLEDQYLIVENVPYVSSSGTISCGDLIAAISIVNGVSQTPSDHTVWFTGSVPCMADGSSLQDALVANLNQETIAGRQTSCRLSNKPDPVGATFDNFYNKMTHYIRKLSSYAHAIDPSVSASTSGVLHIRQEKSVFHYPNTAVARSGLDAYYAKLRLPKIAIVGLGGTGAYILDALAKTPVDEILIYDGDIIEPHNAFRIPGAIGIDEAHKGLLKTDYLVRHYSALRTGISSHPVRVDDSNLHELNDCSFVFIAIDHGPSRGLIARHLVSRQIPFIDVGIGVDKISEVVQLHARARVTLITPESTHLIESLPTAEDSEDGVYNNIQLVELNALNAMLAVIRYKQYIEFFTDEVHPSKLKYVASRNSISLT